MPEIYKIGFVQGPQKLNDESGKTVYAGRTVRGFLFTRKHNVSETGSVSILM
jgi:hypothetical protein